MPLTKAHVNAAGRIMLPTYPVFFAMIGLSFIVTPRERLTASPGLRFADQHVGLHLWGSGFLVVAIVLGISLILERHRGYLFGLAVALGWMLAWTGVMIGSAIFDLASFSAWVWPAFIARCCWASIAALEEAR